MFNCKTNTKENGLIRRKKNFSTFNKKVNRKRLEHFRLSFEVPSRVELLYTVLQTVT